MPTATPIEIRYACAALSVGLATAARSALDPYLGDTDPFLLYFAALAFSAWFGGRGPSLLALALSGLSIAYLLTPHRGSPTIAGVGDRLNLALFLVIGLAANLLVWSMREARRRAEAGVAEVRRALEAERVQGARLHTTLASIADAVITADADGRVTGLNRTAEQLTGWTAQEARGRPLGEVFRSVIEATQQADEMPVAEVLANGAILRSSDSVMLLSRDGRCRPVEHCTAPIQEESGRITGMVLVFRDVTERCQAEQALRESEERFRSLADATPIMIWGSGTDKRCNYFNKPWLDFTGRSIEQEMGDGWSEGVHTEDLKGCLETYVAAFDARAPFTMEYRLRRHDGEYRWVTDIGVPRFAPDGTFSGYIGSCLDITDRKHAEVDLRQSDRRKEEFLAVLSHELRNPLAPMQTALDLLEQTGRSGAESQRELAVIRRQVQGLKRLVDDLMDVSRISRGRIELRKGLVELAPVVAQTVEAVRPLLDDHRHELHLSIPDDTILVDADPTRLEQILSNLLLNADKYTPRGGRIWLDVEPSAGDVVIRVRDTGIGIEPDLLPKVFDLFLQGERRVGLSHEGGGIGLSLAKDLVELHGGTITAHSQGREMGSEFVVKLPMASMARREKERAPKASRLEDSGLPPRRRVLIVDDNVQAADSLARLMSGTFGQEVRVAYNGHSALQVAGSFLPELVLLDLEMPGMDGYEVANRLRGRSECSRAVIVAVTGWGHEEDRRRSQEMGIDLHLVKPVTANDLKAMLPDLRPQVEPGPACKFVTIDS
jgi:PAS domain S-box-containing protein